ncbi:aldo/keto reductase [Halalkalibacterium ligniniphilum]|uniref:aldo/keto reductase n=1 Tax=Halalkalibacterium ligniniphilum TaxID=1134413 RepID=UPI00034DB4C2|nr:aldo/keto reductase [Halalkalibacterium ligniniphilum]
MEKRRLGDSDLLVSELGFGCMSLGTDEKHALNMIDQAIEHGINYLDTADLYDQGLNEAFIGQALKGRREQIILATKVGNRFEKGKEGWSWDPSKRYIKQAVKASLQRLQTDYIDLYQLHGGTIEDHIDETIEAFEELKKEGVIRYYGISSIRPNVIREYLKRSSIVSIMMQYSILDRRPEEWFSLIKEHRVSIVARGPLAKGLLTNRSLDSLGESTKQSGYLDYSYQELVNVREQLTSKISKRSLNEMALRYCLHDDAVATVAAGASTVEQLEDNVEAIDSPPLSKSEIEMIQATTKASRYEQHR